tara:strand:- start:117831 stop:118985 length:1155 start_codon:yes stop_codon:yes gene_type:complete
MKYIKSRHDKDMGDILPNSVWDLHELFKASGKKLIVVGGCVRDFKKGNDKPKDFDLATDATPDEILDICKDYKTTVQGKSFFVVIVYTDDQPMGMEIATFRKDVYGDNLGKTRNPEVEFTTLEDDLGRRDLTYNALYYDMDTKKVVDLKGGIDDMKNKISRFIGDPDLRILEDPLRILRLLRFTTRYDFTIDPETRESIKRNSDKLSMITAERIWDSVNGEFIKAFEQKKNFQDYLNYLTEFDLWKFVLPGLKVNSDEIKSNDNLLLVLSQLIHDNDRKVIQKSLQDLIPTLLVNRILFLKDMLNFDANKVSTFYSTKKRFSLDNDDIKDWLMVNNIQDHDTIKFIYYTPTVSAQKVMSEHGLKQGRELGMKIKELEIEEFKNL